MACESLAAQGQDYFEGDEILDSYGGQQPMFPRKTSSLDKTELVNHGHTCSHRRNNPFWYGDDFAFLEDIPQP